MSNTKILLNQECPPFSCKTNANSRTHLKESGQHFCSQVCACLSHFPAQISNALRHEKIIKNCKSNIPITFESKYILCFLQHENDNIATYTQSHHYRHCNRIEIFLLVTICTIIISLCTITNITHLFHEFADELVDFRVISPRDR